jgi:hypothetical protein
MVIGGGARLTQSWGCGASRFNSDSGLWTRRNGWLKIDPHGGKSTYILNSYAHSAYAEYKLTVCLYIYITRWMHAENNSRPDVDYIGAT